MTTAFKNFVAGSWTDSASGERFENRNPADISDLIGTFPKSGAPDVDAAVKAAQRGFAQWSRTPAPVRGEVLRRVGELLVARKEDIARYADTYEKGWDKVREERLGRQKKLGLVPAGTKLPPRSGYEARRDFFRAGDNPAWDTLGADRRADLARRMAVYAAMVDRLDHNVGRVVADLKEHGQLGNTLILFLSDNGACAEWDPFGFDGSSGPTARASTPARTR